MFVLATEIRVRYADTDQMHFVYNGKYFEYFEVGRTELLRNLNLTYKEVEENGYQLPVLEANIQYFSPAHYDDVLIVETKLTEIPTLKMKIEYSIKIKDSNKKISSGYTIHVFINKETKKAVRPPKFFLDIITPFFQNV